MNQTHPEAVELNPDAQAMRASATRPALRVRWHGVREVVRRHGAVLPIYLILAILFTYPTILHLTDAIGGIVDSQENYWNLWWIKQSLLHLHENPMRGSYMHYPFGLPLYFHTLNPLNGFLSIPLQVCCGIAVAYNVMNLFWFTLAALGAYALAWYVTRNRAAAFIAGLIYGFSPYMAFHLYVGQIPSLSMGLMPLYLLALWKGVRERWTWLPVASVILLLIGLSDWHYLSFSVFMTGLVGIYEAFRVRRLPAIAALFGKLVGVGALFGLLFSPILVPMIAEVAAEPYAARPIRHSVEHSADLLAFFLPSIFHPLWGDWADRIFERLVPPGIVGGIATLGYAALILALIGVFRNLRRSGFWLLLLLVGCVLALGPYLQFNGVNSYESSSPIPLPYLLFRELPFMDINRFASRFVAVAMIGLSVLAAIGVAWLWQRPVLRRLSTVGRGAVLGLIALLVLFEFWARPFPVQAIRGPQVISPFYQQLGTDPSDYAILEVPHLKQTSAFYQTYHAKRTVGGRISREKEHPWYDAARFFAPMLQIKQPWPEIGADDSVAAWRQALSCQNVRYVVFYKQNLDAKVREGSAAVEEALFKDVAPVYEDALLRAYGPITDAPHELYWTPDEDWYKTETNADGVNYRWMQGDHGTLLVYPCNEQQRAATLRFNVVSYAQPRTLRISVNGQEIKQVKADAGQFLTVEASLTLHSGENRVELRSLEPPTSPAALGPSNDDRQLSFLVLHVSVQPR